MLVNLRCLLLPVVDANQRTKEKENEYDMPGHSLSEHGVLYLCLNGLAGLGSLGLMLS
jgi:hypothetical protein